MRSSLISSNWLALKLPPKVMDKHLDKIVVAVIIIIGLISVEYKSRHPGEVTPPSTPFMKCMSLTVYREQIECMRRENLDILDYDEKDNLPSRK